MRYQSGCEVTTATIIPKKKQAATIMTPANASRLWRPPIPAAIKEMSIAGTISRSGCQATPMRPTKIASAARKPATVSAGLAALVSS
jgi:hypothetical protein